MSSEEIGQESPKNVPHVPIISRKPLLREGLKRLIKGEGTFGDVVMDTIPFTIVLMMGLGIMMAFPQLSLFLPGLMK